LKAEKKWFALAESFAKVILGEVLLLPTAALLHRD
jgi:hypothetical protein